jgi:hypothetical protein
MIAPIMTTKKPVEKPTKSVCLAPATVCAKTSCPCPLVPKRNSTEGGDKGVPIKAIGSFAKKGPTIEIKITPPIRYRPIKDFFSLKIPLAHRFRILFLVLLMIYFLVLGSKSKITISTNQFASKTARVIVINKPCIKGKSCDFTD